VLPPAALNVLAAVGVRWLCTGSVLAAQAYPGRVSRRETRRGKERPLCVSSESSQLPKGNRIVAGAAACRIRATALARASVGELSTGRTRAEQGYRTGSSVVGVTISRARMTWSGFKGAPGFTTLYNADPNGPPLSTLATAWNAQMALLPTGVTLTISHQGDTIDSANGQINGSWSKGSDVVLPGTGAAMGPLPSGGQTIHSTDQSINGHHVRGRIFWVPLAASTYGSDGLLTGAAVTKLTALATALVSSDPTAQYCVWHRPKKVKDDTGALVVVSPGQACVITGGKSSNVPVVMRSRRD